MTGVKVQAPSLAELGTSLRGWATKVSLRGIEEKRWHEPRLSQELAGVGRGRGSGCWDWIGCLRARQDI
jgi:hypothetical protein